MILNSKNSNSAGATELDHLQKKMSNLKIIPMIGLSLFNILKVRINYINHESSVFISENTKSYLQHYTMVSFSVYHWLTISSKKFYIMIDKLLWFAPVFYFYTVYIFYNCSCYFLDNIEIANCLLCCSG